METMKEKKERTRRAYAPRGERSQKMMSFRVDNDNWDWLGGKANKGRYINQLIAADREGRGADGEAVEADGESP